MFVAVLVSIPSCLRVICKYCPVEATRCLLYENTLSLKSVMFI